MSPITKCKFFGSHKYEPYKEEDAVDAKGNKIGIIIISKCAFCGRIKHDVVYTEENYVRR